MHTPVNILMSGYGSGEAVRECLEEGHDLVLLRIGQAQLPYRHVKVVGNLGPSASQSTFFRSFPAGQFPEVYREGELTSLVL